jgi:hypothetical protein
MQYLRSTAGVEVGVSPSPMAGIRDRRPKIDHQCALQEFILAFELGYKVSWDKLVRAWTHHEKGRLESKGRKVGAYLGESLVSESS